MTVIRLVNCGIHPCKKPGRWFVSAVCYLKGPLKPGDEPLLVTVMTDKQEGLAVCEHHMQNMPDAPAEFFTPEYRDAVDEALRQNLTDERKENYGGLDYDRARWHFERMDGQQAMPGALV